MPDDWDGGIWVDTAEGSPEPQKAIKSAIENIAKIDIENLEFLLKMIKNLSFDIAGGNFINLNGSIFREDGGQQTKHRKLGMKVYGKIDENQTEPLASNPISLDETFVKTDWGFVYCGVIDITQFLFTQGGYHWIWQNGVMRGWVKKPSLQITTLVVGNAVPDSWYTKQTYPSNVNSSKVGQMKIHTSYTTGMKSENIFDIVNQLPSFEELMIEEYGSWDSYQKWLDSKDDEYVKDMKKMGRASTAQIMNWAAQQRIGREWRKQLNAFKYISYEKMKQKTLYQIIQEKYGKKCDFSFSMRGGNVIIQDCEKNKISCPSSVSLSNHTSSVIQWNSHIGSKFFKGKSPKKVKQWRKVKIFNFGNRTMEVYDADRDNTNTSTTYSIEDIDNFNFNIYQYKMSQGILNRMVL